MSTNYKKNVQVEDSEIELFERLKMCLMLNELLNKNIGKDFKYGWEKVDSYISEFQLRQIFIAYIQVVIDTLHKYNSNSKYKDYIIILDAILEINIGSETVGKIIYDFRNKTFHPQGKSFSNTKELYEVYFNDLILRCSEITKIFEEMFYLLISDKNRMISGVFKFYNSKFYHRLKNEGDKNE